MSRTRAIVVAVLALLALLAVFYLGRTPHTPPDASPSPSTPGQPATSTPAINESLRPTSPDTPVPTSKALLTFEGGGVKSSGPFTASGDSVALAYHFDCSALGTSGTFIETFYDMNGLVLDTVKEFAKSGARTTVVYIANTAPPYHLDVNSQCTWAITVTGAP